MVVVRRIRRAPVASFRKFCDFGIIIAVILGGYYFVNRDWSKYSNALKLRLDNYTVVHGFVGGLGNSQYIRGVAFNKFKKKSKSYKGRVVVNGPLNINHKAVFQHVNFTNNGDLGGQKFLLPLQQVGLKIHQVVNSLKDAVIMAAALNRTLVLPPLLHVTSKRRVNDFETNETTLTAWDSWRTIDYNPLSKKINMIGIHQYRQICGRTEGMDTVFSCQRIGVVKSNHFRYQDMFKEVWGFEPLDLMAMNDTIQFTNPIDVKQLDVIESNGRILNDKLDLKHFVEKFEPAGKCATIVYPNLCLKNRFQEWTDVSPYFKLHPRVKSIADGFIRKMIHGDRYAVIRMDFLTSCSGPGVEQMSKKMKELCNISLKLPVEFLVNRIRSMMEEYKVKFVYFSGFEEKRVDELISNLPTNTGLKYANMLNYIKTNKPTHMNSTVDFSLVEQDLAFRSSLFLGSTQSEWAKMISIDRTGPKPDKLDCSIMEYLVNARCVPIMQNDEDNTISSDTTLKEEVTSNENPVSTKL